MKNSLPPPDPRNGKAKNKLLQRKIDAWPRRNLSEPGWIYIYRFASETGRWKVGSTKLSDPAERVKQWHKRAQMQYCLYLPCGYQWAERVIHLYLWYCRLYRYALDAEQPGGDPRFYSVWARDLKLPALDPLPAGYTGRPPAKNKQIEWFYIDLDELVTLVKRVCATAGAPSDAREDTTE